MLYIIALMSAALSLYAMGEYTSKLWTLSPSWWMGIVTCCLFSISTIPWLYALRAHGHLSALGPVFTLIGLVICVLMGTFLFEETITSKQIVGLIFALLATFLIY